MPAAIQQAKPPMAADANAKVSTKPVPQTGDPSQSPAESKTAAEPRVLRVGPEDGMLTLAEAFKQAEGGDVIEIATDEPIVLSRSLVWNKPGSLMIRAAEGARPILMPDPDFNGQMLVFARSGEFLPTFEHSIHVNGLTMIDFREQIQTAIYAYRPIHFSNVIYAARSGWLVQIYENPESCSLENCYVWKMQTNKGTPSIRFASESVSTKMSICNCVFVGESSLGCKGDIDLKQSVFIWGKYPIYTRDGLRQLAFDRNLIVGMERVIHIEKLPSSWKAPETQQALAALEPFSYQGTNNSYFQCKRFAPQLSPKAEAELAAWQAFTGNGERNPRFEDPQFLQPNQVILAKEKLLPPKAFALKSTSRLRRLNIGCDVDKLPDLPPRLIELLPDEIRYDGK